MQIHELETNKKIKLIREVKFETSSSILKERLTPLLYEKALRLSKEVRVFEILYFSNEKLISGYIVEPRDLKEKVAGVLYNRGGTKDFGAIKLGTLFTTLAEISSWGYIVSASQYSGGPNSEGIDEWGGDDLDDIVNLHKIIKKHPFIDESRMGMVGVSRGGMMTYLALKKMPSLKAAVISSGVSNLLRMKEFRPEMWAMYTDILGNQVEEKCKKRSILFSVEELPSNIPILILHGTNDLRVSPLDAIEISAKLFEYKKPFKLVIYEGADHSLTEVKDEATSEVKSWLEKYVKNNFVFSSLTKD